MNIGVLINTVQRNCHISDARYAGNYTMCSFLMKMREFFRWEYDIPYSSSLSREAIGNWLQEREQVWEQLESMDYAPLPLGEGRSDPFDTQRINHALVPQGYVYSSGYGVYAKPHFFVGELSRKFERDGIKIYISSCEYARDLVAPPAMLVGDSIFIRQESVSRYIWEKIEEWLWKQQADTPMARAIRCYGGPEDPEQLVERMTVGETETMILHELGEVQAGRLLGDTWEQMLAEFTDPRLEHLLRAARDNLADCLVTLPELIAREATASLHFYFANFTGLRRQLFPQAPPAYRRWVKTQDLGALQQLVAQGRDAWETSCRQILEIYTREGNLAADQIARYLEQRPS